MRMRPTLGDAARWRQPLVEMAVPCGKPLCVYVKKIDFDKELSLKERGLNKMQNFILYLASLSFIRRGIEGEVSQGHKLYVI